MMAKNAVKFEIHYDDGSVVEVKRGMLIQMSDFDESGKAEIAAELAGMSVQNLLTLASASHALAEKILDEHRDEEWFDDCDGEEDLEE